MVPRLKSRPQHTRVGDFLLLKLGMKKPELQDYGLSQSDIEKIESLNRFVEKRSTILTKFLMLFVSLVILLYFGWKVLILSWASIFGPVVVWGVLELIAKSYLRDKYFDDPLKKLEEKIKNYQEDIKKFKEWFVRTNENFWLSLGGHAFEHEVASLFEKLGAHAEVTKGSGDGGIDIFLRDGSEVAIVQCKAHKSPVGPSVVRDLYGVMNHGGFRKAYLVTLRGVTKGASDFIKGKDITVLDLHSLIKLQLSIDQGK